MADGRWQFYFWIGGDDGDSNKIINKLFKN